MAASKLIEPLSGTAVPRWQLALLVGAPILLGVGAVYLFDRMSLVDHAREANRKGINYFNAAKYQNAIHCFTEAIELCPTERKRDLSEFYHNRAGAYEQKMKWTEVVKDCTEALTRNPHYTTAFLKRAKAHEKLDNKKECLEDSIAASILEDYLNIENMIRTRKIIRQMGNEGLDEYENREWTMPSPQYIKSYFGSFTDDIISQPLQKGEKKDEDEDNEGEASEVTASHHLSSGYLKAKHYMDEEEYEKIISECTKEVDSEGRYMAEALLLRATFHLLTGNVVAAEADLDRIINMQEANVKLRANALIKRGSLYNQTHERLLSRKHFNMAAEIDACNPDVYHHRGQLKMVLNQFEGAVEDFDKSILLRSDFALTQAQRSFALFTHDYTEFFGTETKMQEALDGCKDVIKRFPTCAEGYALYAQALTRMKLFGEADEMYDKCIEVEPDNATHYVYKGLLQLRWKRDLDWTSMSELGLDLIGKAIEIDNKCAFAYESMGCVELLRLADKVSF
ncbi:mitochondrial import receptor subunit TOM70-like isoform X2 [Corythoichthys intestinalis]|uniref:mitochondrial import receptor subunit TOM70-like isoform X2 n=1 Tax=Corythoichthys intestinalis TaxID=161448 RepID=UPI0025A54424|nr:mitochondrial import receptor subunit TOM70-like isoform X2 [Corythoichthys intestinalis]